MFVLQGKLSLPNKRRFLSVTMLTLLLVGTLILGFKVQAAVVKATTVTISAYCNTEGAAINVAIMMDGSPTGHSTPYTFAVTGVHTFTVPNTDAMGHAFKQWNTGETTTTITVTDSGTYTAYYEATTPETGPSHPVGGRIVSANPLGFLVPRLVFAALTIIGTVAIIITIVIIGLLILRKSREKFSGKCVQAQ